MSIHVSCPACRMTLNVPDHLLGKRVKCPECATPFDAQPEAPPQAPALVPPPPADLPPPMSAPDRRPSPRPELWDDSYGRGDPALGRAQAPAILLIVMAILGLLGSLAMFMLFLMVLIAPPPNQPNQGDAALGSVIILGFLACQMILLGLVIYGANEMRKLGSYGWAMTSCILAIIPGGSPCCLLGIPFAIWGLAVINDPAVQQAFRSAQDRQGFRDDPLDR